MKQWIGKKETLMKHRRKIRERPKKDSRKLRESSTAILEKSKKSHFIGNRVISNQESNRFGILVRLEPKFLVHNSMFIDNNNYHISNSRSLKVSYFFCRNSQKRQSINLFQKEHYWKSFLDSLRLSLFIY
jgi:hypothetical protein